MNLQTYCKKHSAARLAAAIGVTSSAIAQWLTGERPIPIKRCVLIERATRGKVTRQELLADWREIWPELEAIERARGPIRASRRPSTHTGAGYPQLRRSIRQNRAPVADLLQWSVAGCRAAGHPRFKEIRL